MQTDSELSKLMDRLSRFQNASIGFGPCHPTEPNVTISQNITEFLVRYSVLEKYYPDYILFLNTYSGARIDYECDFENVAYLDLDIFGFDESITGAYRDDESDLEDDGFLIFSSLNYRYRKWNPESGLPYDGIRMSYFLLNLSPSRQNGIYLFLHTEPFDPMVKEDLSQSVFFCSSFLEWLEQYVSSGGRIPKHEYDEFPKMAQQPVY